MDTTPTTAEGNTAPKARRRIFRRMLVALLVAGALVGAVGASPASAEDNVTNEYKVEYYTVEGVVTKCQKAGGTLESPILGTWRGWHSCEDSEGNELFYCVRDPSRNFLDPRGTWLCPDGIPAPETNGANVGTAPHQSELTASTTAGPQNASGIVVMPSVTSDLVTEPTASTTTGPQNASGIVIMPNVTSDLVTEPTASTTTGPQNASGIVIMPVVTSGFLMRG